MEHAGFYSAVSLQLVSRCSGVVHLITCLQTGSSFSGPALGPGGPLRDPEQHLECSCPVLFVSPFMASHQAAGQRRCSRLLWSSVGLSSWGGKAIPTPAGTHERGEVLMGRRGGLDGLDALTGLPGPCKTPPAPALRAAEHLANDCAAS